MKSVLGSCCDVQITIVMMMGLKCGGDDIGDGYDMMMMIIGS